MENLRLGNRISHALEPDMYGTVLDIDSDGRVLVQWDGGVSQWMYPSQIRPRLR